MARRLRLLTHGLKNARRAPRAPINYILISGNLSKNNWEQQIDRTSTEQPTVQVTEQVRAL